MLNMIRHGTATDTPPLVIVHGLFGSGRNWGVIAKRLSDRGLVVAVDMRNHGDSFRDPSHSYPDMARDLAEVIDDLGGRADVVGHSMGGKAAMVLALDHPETVGRLVVADIAPVGYAHSQSRYIDAMRSVDLDRVEKRADAMAQLKDVVDDPTLPGFFTQSLDVAERRWKLNLDALDANMDAIVGFPEDQTGTFDGPTLFLTGGKSDYVLPDHRPTIRGFFPKARFAKLPEAGHWLHAEKPRDFEASVRAFLDH